MSVLVVEPEEGRSAYDRPWERNYSDVVVAGRSATPFRWGGARVVRRGRVVVVHAFDRMGERAPRIGVGGVRRLGDVVVVRRIQRVLLGDWRHVAAYSTVRVS